MGRPVEPADLAEVTLLQGAARAELALIASSMTIGTAAGGQVLGYEGEEGRTFWLLLEGRAEVERRTAEGVEHLALAGPGSILGELAVLRGQPRTATVRAVGDCRYAMGDRDALDRLVAVPEVRARLVRLASARLAHDLRPVPVVLGDGTRLVVRPLLPEDRAALGEAIRNLSRESVRRRFFSSGTPSQALIDYLVDIDFVDHFAWVVVEAERPFAGVASARFVRTAASDDAEMAFTTADAFQRRGIGTMLLGAIGVAAVEAGISTLSAHVMEDNVAMRTVFAKAKARSAFDEPGVVIVRVDPAEAAALLGADQRRALAEAVRDVVTAASLALAHPHPL